MPKLRIPIAEVHLPEVELPEFPPKLGSLDDRELDLIKYGAMDDIADIVPVVGDIFSDMAYKELVAKMSDEEYKAFLEENKLLPSSLAALKVIIQRRIREKGKLGKLET
ncbi:MAG: hypothetical protein JRD89_00605 [Deltaproteobacteria bacterium]|nr:hypothetical protein [Deltaproteobacteria bacterium]